MATESIPQTLFGRRLREARKRQGVPQDKLGVLIGLDEGSSSARISRYESGIHEPPFAIASKLAAALGVPVAYLFCEEDDLAKLLVDFSSLGKKQRSQILQILADLTPIR
jgi:transcriptional regulator with XRE-family HTH domain